MMVELLSAVGDVPLPIALGIIVAWAVSPGPIARLAILCYPRGDGNRYRILRGIYRQRNLVQPFWALQQLERGVFDGIARRYRTRNTKRRRN